MAGEQLPLFIPEVTDLRRFNSELRIELEKQVHKNMKFKKIIIFMANCANCYPQKGSCKNCVRNPKNPGLKDNWRYKK
ncbi:hypothetical protein KAR91_57095 [Candidatus Pacearchaeota archaeon]|nr:hypothetical protein [Candidatus Pacearchaeota archaeon]